MRKAFSFLTGAAIGGLMGAILALLFAPASGEEMRIQIGTRAQSFAADVRQAAVTRRIELQDRLETLRTPQE